jgi:aldehyde dehydrogenase (NAD+)
MQKFAEKALDHECYQCVQGGVQTAIRATSSKLDLIIYTGSTEKGKLVAQAAAKNLVPCILELGGKSPLIVDKTADVNYAAMKTALGAFINFGQTCVRPDYCLVEYTMVHKFIEELKSNLKDYDKGILGHSISTFHHERVCKLLKDH